MENGSRIIQEFYNFTFITILSTFITILALVDYFITMENVFARFSSLADQKSSLQFESDLIYNYQRFSNVDNVLHLNLQDEISRAPFHHR